MTTIRTKIKILDNSGALIGRCIKIYGGSKHWKAGLGDYVLVSVVQAHGLNSLSKKYKVSRGKMFRAVVLSSKSWKARPDYTSIRSKYTAGILVNAKGGARATRIFMPAPYEIGKIKLKALTLSPTVI